ncbi:alpha/beta fold hydrolase [Pseudoduganella sp. RAF53_2]|uniref:alpha/beta fold hydrolase n=1 Tax=unclassified Pseudoduganella TaxID=2637179 RepID=UPI003F96CE80
MQLQLGENSLYYELIAGDDTRPLLVFLHEGLGCTAMWKDFPRHLCEATGRAGLVYDRLGYGQSSPLRKRRGINYLHEYALLELPEVLARLADGREYVIVGHSDGASIALIHAADQPAGLRGVISAAAHVFVEPLTLEGVRVARDSHGAGKMRGLSRYHGDKAETIFFAWADTWLDPAFVHWNIEYLLPSVACPLLAMQGRDDQYGSGAQLDSIAAKAVNARKLVVDDCGHSPHIEQPDAVVDYMAEFIRSL